VRIFVLSAPEIETHWQEFLPWLERIACCGDLTAQEIRESVKASRMQLWGLQDDVAVRGIALTEILGRGSICAVIAAAGHASADLQRQVHESIAAWAKSIGCTRMRLQGRKGWLRQLGYRQTGIVGEKSL